MNIKEGRYEAAQRITIVEAPNLRVRMISLAAGQCVPWHYHSNITDRFFCMEGPMQVITRDPDVVQVLDPGGVYAVGPQIAHYVAGVDKKACKFMNVQGVGVYDFISLEG